MCVSVVVETGFSSEHVGLSVTVSLVVDVESEHNGVVTGFCCIGVLVVQVGDTVTVIVEVVTSMAGVGLILGTLHVCTVTVVD